MVFALVSLVGREVCATPRFAARTAQAEVTALLRDLVRAKLVMVDMNATQ
jgi:hypothetical protein